MKHDFSILTKRLAKINFANIEDSITESGKKLQEKYQKILEKYNLDGFMEMSGCLTIYANDNYNITLGGKDLEDMSGWTISSDDGKFMQKIAGKTKTTNI